MFRKQSNEIPKNFLCNRSDEIMTHPVVVVINGESHYIDKSELVPGEQYKEATRLQKEIEAWRAKQPLLPNHTINSQKVASQQKEEKKPDHEFRYILMGDNGVGKTALVNRFVKDRFSTAENSGSQSDPTHKSMSVAGQTTNAIIFDFNNLDRDIRDILHRQIAQRKADVAIFVYDLNIAKTFDSITDYLNEAEKYLPKNCIKILVGTKIDLENQRVISKKRAEKFAEDNNMRYYEVSAKEQKVDKIFVEPTEQLIAQKACTNQIEAVDLYLSNREQKSSNEYIGCLDRFFGGCSLTQKQAAVRDLKKTISGKMTLADLERNNKKALSQGNLGELYERIRPSLGR